jgi:hypothetical protein
MRYFENIRNLFEEWEFFAEIFGQDTLVQGCGPEELALYPLCKEINDRRDAAVLAGEFFLNVLKTPDHTCLVIDNDERSKRTPINLRDFYEDEMQYDYRYNNYIPKSCFEKPVIDKIDEVHNGFVFAEAGKYLNEIRGNSDTQIYANDREVIGTWQDKALAMKALVQREKNVMNTETGHMSLAEHPSISNGFAMYMNHILLGSPLVNGVPFKDVVGNTYPVPYEMKDLIIEAPGDQLSVLKNFLGISQDSGAKTLLVSPLLHMISEWSITDDFVTKEESYNFHNVHAVRQASISSPISSQFFQTTRVNDYLYSANRDNAYALQMIGTMNGLAKLQEIKQQEPGLIERVTSERMNATLPGSLSEQQIEAAGLPGGLLDQLISLSSNQVELDLARVQSSLGPELGQKVFDLYTNMSTEALIEVKDALSDLGNIAPEDATDLELTLYGYPKEMLMAFQEGKLQEKIQYFGKILKLMPAHKHH